jgi:hypothetical protein
MPRAVPLRDNRILSLQENVPLPIDQQGAEWMIALFPGLSGKSECVAHESQDIFIH